MQRILQGIMKKNNTWNIRRLVNESFDPATQSIILKIIGFLAIETIDLINFKANNVIKRGQTITMHFLPKNGDKTVPICSARPE